MQLWVPEHGRQEALERLPEGVDLHTIPRRGALPPEIAEAEFLVPPDGSRRVLEALPRMHALRVIQAMSAGVEWLEPSAPEGVTLCNARGAMDIPVAEWVVAAVLALAKRVPELGHQQEEERWEPRLLDELAGSRALIVGHGSIGRAVEERLAPFGVEVERVARSAREGVHSVDELADLLPRADIVVVLVPATPASEGLFDDAMLARLKPGALFVNAGRGSVVDTDALVDVVRAGHVRAALDVTDPEPLPEGHPLWSLPGVLITPHVAGATEATERRIYELVADQVGRYVRGDPLLNVLR